MDGGGREEAKRDGQTERGHRWQNRENGGVVSWREEAPDVWLDRRGRQE